MEVFNMDKFNVKETKNRLIEWIKEYFETNGKGCNAIIGISGGKDSSVVAALCTEALGKDKVIGILMPQNIQSDIQYSKDLVKHLGIQNYTVNIGNAVDTLLKEISKTYINITQQTKINLPARIRMSTLYAISQSLNGRVANTCNLSEDWVGYATRYGDAAGDFSPLSDLTVQEVKAIGRELGLPEKFIEKVPIDGLCGKTDEDNLGFLYEVLDRYIRTGICEDKEIKSKIDEMHEKNLFKLQLMPSFKL